MKLLMFTEYTLHLFLYLIDRKMNFTNGNGFHIWNMFHFQSILSIILILHIVHFTQIFMYSIIVGQDGTIFVYSLLKLNKSDDKERENEREEDGDLSPLSSSVSWVRWCYSVTKMRKLIYHWRWLSFFTDVYDWFIEEKIRVLIYSPVIMFIFLKEMFMID